jgi:hypothetical protein
VLDFETGIVFPFKAEPVLGLIKRDPVLYDELIGEQAWMSAGALLAYIVKYNNRNPVYVK